MHIELPLLLTGVLLIGFLCQWLAWRIRLPAILFLLLTGIVAGPVTGILDPDALLGDLLMPFVSLGVAIILFEGSLTLRFSEIRGVGPSILNLVSFGALITLSVLAWTVHTVMDMDTMMALLFGAIVCVTGPTVIVPMLRSVRPNERISNVLRWEGIIIDPLGALLAVLVYEAIISGQQTHSFVVFGYTILTGVATGVAGAFALSQLLRRHLIPEYLHNFGTLAIVLSVYTVSNTLYEESGLLTVTVMGMILANMKNLHIEDILDFKENLSTLLISALFILLAARLQVPTSWTLIMGGAAVLFMAQFVARPLSILVSTLGSSLTWKERGLLAWIAPRGIVAAAVSALFALKLETLGIAGAEYLVPLTFSLIIGTVVLQSATAAPLARWLGVADPEPRGVLIVGSSRAARMVARALMEQKVPVLMADDDWAGIRAARMDNIPTYFGNPVSEHADRHLDLVGLGKLLAMSTRRELNSLACVRYRPEFGLDKVFYMRNLAPRSGSNEKDDFVQTLRAPALFGEDVTQAKIEDKLDAGWRVKSTRLGGEFTYARFKEINGEETIPLFTLDDKGLLKMAAMGRKFEPKNGWKLCALVPPTAGVESDASKAELNSDFEKSA